MALRNVKLAIASPSLGQHKSHTLPQKIIAAAQNDIRGLEITFPDLQAYASSQSLGLEEAAQDIKAKCAEAPGDLQIVSLCPFENFEGHQSPISERLATAKQWLKVARALGAEYLQVPSAFDKSSSTDAAMIVDELIQLADLAASEQPVIRIGYENLAWSTHCCTWRDAVRIVRDVDRPNFGLCLDSFHLAVTLWGDPYSSTGIQPNGPRQLAESLQELIKECPRDKVFYVQLSDGERMNPPYSTAHPWFDPALEVGHVWSNEARPFPLETECGAYMPVVELAEAFLKGMGFEGWVSLETFDRRMREPEMGPERNAERAKKSWGRLADAMKADGS